MLEFCCGPGNDQVAGESQVEASARAGPEYYGNSRSREFLKELDDVSSPFGVWHAARCVEDCDLGEVRSGEKDRRMSRTENQGGGRLAVGEIPESRRQLVEDPRFEYRRIEYDVVRAPVMLENQAIMGGRCVGQLSLRILAEEIESAKRAFGFLSYPPIEPPRGPRRHLAWDIGDR